MKQTVFPKEIIRFSQENHYFRFSRQPEVIYLVVIVFLLTGIAALPFVEVDISIQGQGIIRSKNDINKLFSLITGQTNKKEQKTKWKLWNCC